MTPDDLAALAALAAENATAMILPSQSARQQSEVYNRRSTLASAVPALIAEVEEARRGHAEWYDEATKALRSLTNRTGERDAARAAVERVRALHADVTAYWCGACGSYAPCATIRALDGETP